MPNLDTANVKMTAITEKYEGYVSSMGTYQTIVRVKSPYLNQAIADISLLGKLKSKNLTGRDVSEQYYDFKIRLENAEKARARYLELLAKAEDVSAALLVERELERLNGEIDVLKGRMNRMDHLSDYATITIEWKERKKLGILGYIGKGLYEGVRWLFVRN